MGIQNDSTDVEALLDKSTNPNFDVSSVGTIVEVAKNTKTRVSSRKLLWFGIIGFTAVVSFGLLTISGYMPGEKTENVQLLSGVSRSMDISNGRILQETTETTCEEPYGLLPCSTSLGGNLFLMLAYGYLLLTAAKLISEGSEMLLQVLNPGLIGGLVLPVLGAFPDALLIVVSGIGGTAEEAQDEVVVGMGVLAGSTIMILTIAWGGSLIFGRCDLVGPNGTAKDRTLTTGFSLFGSGVTTDEQTRWGAWIMIISVLPYIILQIPLIDGRNAVDGHTSALISLILAFVFLTAYCAYQVMIPSLQEKKMENARLHYLKTAALSGIHNKALESGDGLVLEDGSPNFDTIYRIFDQFDDDKNGTLCAMEVKGLITGLQLVHGGLPNQQQEHSDALQKNLIREFDTDDNGLIGRDEFKNGMCKWLEITKPKKQSSSPDESSSMSQSSSLDGRRKSALSDMELMKELEAEEEDEDETTEALTPAQIYKQATILMLGGALLVAVFADPMVDAISNFSTASGIPAFFVAFVVTPIASNASELVSSLLFAMKKRKRTISLTYSQVYGAITMNNTLCLGVFLGVVYFRGLTWEFSSEVTVILLSTLIVGIVGGTNTTFKLYLAIPMLLLYPLTIGIVAFLDYVLGWQ